MKPREFQRLLDDKGSLWRVFSDGFEPRDMEDPENTYWDAIYDLYDKFVEFNEIEDNANLYTDFGGFDD